jgi:microcystin-dependent protein
MPTPLGYFLYPFAIDGDTADISVTTQPSGVISYQQGYGPYYERNLLIDPLAQPIGRLTMNQLFFELCSQLQQYSQYGTPNFITSLQNGGSPYPYPIYARTYYGGVVYENQVAANTATPGTDASWLPISGDSTGVLPGSIIAFGGINVPAGYLPCDDSAVSRSTYATLFAALTQVQTVTTTVSSSTVTVASTNNLYVGMQVECANFPSGTIILTITPSTTITVSNTATAGSSVPMTFFQWGNGDGSTTFNTPGLNRMTLIGSGGTPYAGTTAGQVNSNAIGFTGGQEAHTQTVGELAQHNHVIQYFSAQSSGAGAPWVTVGTGSTFNTNNTGSSTPFNVMQPSAIVNYIIKT